MSALLLLVRLVLAAVFVVAGVAKLRDRSGARKTVTDFGVPASVAGAVAVLVPIAELGCAVALVPVPTAWWGAAGLLALLLVFTAAMIVAMARGKAVDCRCFGQLHARRVGPATLARNLALAAMAGLIAIRNANDVGPGMVTSLAALDGGQMLNLVLGLVIVGGVFALMQLLTQYGKLLIRVEALEGQMAAGGVPAPAPAPPPVGLPVGTSAQAFSLKGLDGNMATLETLGASGNPVLLVFVAPGCSACDELLPDVAAWQRDHKDKLTVALLSRGESETRSKVKRHGIRSVLLQKESETADAYQVPATPAAVLVKSGSVASRVKTGADAIRALVADATLPPPVKRGELVPAMKVPTLDGGSMDLTSLPARALLLFWNPGCGFCQQMLDDLKRWQRENVEGFALVVASAGSNADIRANGFKAPVILDDASSVMRVFGATGTPSAVVIEGGRVVSEVGVGAPGVWKVAGVSQPVPA